MSVRHLIYTIAVVVGALMITLQSGFAVAEALVH